MRRPTAVPVLALTAALIGVGACAADPNDGAGDAPIGAVEKEPWTVMNNIDGFPNVATRCYGGNGIYVTRSAGDSSDALVVVRDDPACDRAETLGTTPP